MNIPAGLKQLREATTCAGANALLSAGWELVSIESRQSGREGNALYIMGWSQEGSPTEPTKPDRTSGNLAADARQ